MERTRAEEFESYLTVERGKRKNQGNVCGSVKKPVGREGSLDNRVRGNTDLKILPRSPEIDSTTLDNSVSWSETLLHFLWKKTCAAS